MSSFVARRLFSTVARRMPDQVSKDASKQHLTKDSKQNPEVFILGGVMLAALGGAGYYFGRNPTSANSESQVVVAEGGRPWESDIQGQYKYHPGADTSRAPKEAPSAVNVVVVPKMKLPAEVHEHMNKWGKDGYP